MLYNYSNGIISVIFPQTGDIDPDAEPAKDGVRAKFATPDHEPTCELGTVEDISGMVSMDVLMNKWIACDVCK